MPAAAVSPTAAETKTVRQWTEANLAGAATAPFSFRYDGQPSSELLQGWKAATSVENLDKHRTRRTIAWTDPKTGLEVRCEAVEYSDYPTLEWVVYLKNTGQSDTPILEGLQALDVSLPATAGEELNVHYAKGSEAAYSDFAPLVRSLAAGERLAIGSHGRGGTRGGNPSVEAMPFVNLQWGNQGVLVGLGWTGPWTATFARAADGSLKVQAGMEQMHLLLKPGEEIRSPRVVALFWQGDRLRAHNLWRRFLLDYHSPKPDGKPFAGLIADGNWGSWMDAAKHIEEINFWGDHDLPMECYWVDAGWTDMSQGWEAHQSHQVPNAALFPNGMRPLADAAHARGMKFLLWMVPESVHPAVGIGKEHPEWLGKPFSSKDYGAMVFHGLDHGDPQVNQFMIDHFSKVVSDFGADIFRQDGGNLWPDDTDPNRIGMSQIRYIEGFYAFWDGILKRSPGLLIDNCAEGGRKIDVETISRSIVLWRSDCQASGDFDPVSSQGFNYGLLPWVPLCGGVATVKNLSVYSFRSAYCPALLIGWPMGNVASVKDRWSSVDLALLRKLLKEYVAVRPYLFGDFYPLTPYSIDANTWLAWQFDRPDLGEGMVQAFRRPECTTSGGTYLLHGLDAEATYNVMDLDSGSSRKMTGKSLMTTGLDVNIADQPGAAVVTYKRAP
jgi:alpha-galactosidase